MAVLHYWPQFAVSGLFIYSGAKSIADDAHRLDTAANVGLTLFGTGLVFWLLWMGGFFG